MDIKTKIDEIRKKAPHIIPILAVSIVVLSTSAYLLFNHFTNNSKDQYVYYGTAEADQINITSELAGKIKDINVQEGQKISAGDLVAVIDSSENTIRLQQSEISLKSAQTALDKVNEGSRDEEIKAQQALVSQAEATVKQGQASLNQANNNATLAQANYDYKLKNYNDAKTLYDSGYESKSAVDSAKNVLDNAKDAYDNAVAGQDNAKSQLAGLKSQLEAAKQKLNLLVNGATEQDKASARYSVDLADKNYELSKLNLDKSNINSVSSGIIETVNYRQGEYVNPGSPVATLLDTQNMYVKIYIPEKDLYLVSAGKEVTLKSDFLKDITIKGKISYISSDAEFTPMNIITKKDREKLVFAVKVKILDNLDSIKSGMLLDVNIQ